MESKAFGTVRPRAQRSCCSLGRGGSAGGRRVGYRYHILDPSASREVALAGCTHQRGGCPPPRLAGTRRRGTAAHSGVRRFSGSCYEGERRRNRRRGNLRRGGRGRGGDEARPTILRGGDSVQVAGTGGGRRGHSRIQLPQGFWGGGPPDPC